MKQEEKIASKGEDHYAPKNISMIPEQYKNTIEQINNTISNNTGHHGIKVSLTDKTSLVQSQEKPEHEITHHSITSDKQENQKMGIQKLKVYSNSNKSNKSSPSGSHSSHKRQTSTVTPDIKTKPFIAAQHET